MLLAGQYFRSLHRAGACSRGGVPLLTWRFLRRSISACTLSVSQPLQFSDIALAYLDHAQFALGHINQFDLLNGHCLTSPPIEGLVDGPKGPLPDAVSESLRVGLSAVSHFSQIGPAVENNGGLPAADSPDPATQLPLPQPSSNKEPTAGRQATRRS
jgi:hypothetical protein